MHALARFGVLILLPAVLAGCHKPKVTPSAEEQIKPDVTVTADQLIEDYKKNHIAADQKYKGKKVQVTGPVAGTGQVALAGDYIALGSGHEGEFDVMCFLYKGADGNTDKAVADKAAKLKQGDTTTLLGVCEGKVLGFTAVRLKLCFFPDEKK
jgi:hypothetical protein